MTKTIAEELYDKYIAMPKPIYYMIAVGAFIMLSSIFIIEYYPTLATESLGEFAMIGLYMFALPLAGLGGYHMKKDYDEYKKRKKLIPKKVWEDWI